MMLDRLFAVIITYNPNNDINSLLDTFAKTTQIDQNNCVIINTALPIELNNVKLINSAFEFSGYQYGLQKVIDEVARRGYPESTFVNIVFMNDTAITAHVPGLVHFFSRLLINVLGREPGTQAVIGVGQHCGAPYNDVAVAGYYFPTYLFALRASVSTLKRTYLYDSRLASPKEIDELYALLPAAFQDSIYLWLNPSKFLRGWYKASPFKKTDSQTLYRKKLAIYFELSLPSLMLEQGYKLNDIGIESQSVKFALFVDRIYVNILKLTYRIRLWLDWLVMR